MKRSAFTLIELMLVLSIIALLTGIMLPALAKSRSRARALVCQINQRSAGQIVQFYLEEQKALPFTTEDITGGATLTSTANWDTALSTFTCPDQKQYNQWAYFKYRPGRMLTRNGATIEPDPLLLRGITRHYEDVPADWLFVEAPRVHSGRRNSTRMDGRSECSLNYWLDVPPLEH